MSDKPSVYAQVLNKVKGKKQLTAEEVARLDAVVRRVGWTESKNKPDAKQPNGPGRGEFQFETSAGSGEASTAAKNRLKNFKKIYGNVEIPEKDKKELAKEDPDFSKLSQDTQRAMVVINWVAKTPGDEVGELARGNLDPGEFWLDYHWAGKEEDRPAKRAQWDREMLDYERMVGRANQG